MTAIEPKALCDKGFRKFRLARAGEGAHYPQMPSIRTRKPAIAACLGGLAWVCACAAPANAAAPGVSDLRMALEPQPANAPLAPRQIAISGKAPFGCVPAIDRLSVDGADLSIVLKAQSAPCNAKNYTRFHLRADSAVSAAAPLLPGQVYRARVYSTDNGASSLLAFGLLDTNTPASAPIPESGLWWSEASAETGAAAAGNGASIELQDGRLAVGLFGFGETGAATWQFGTAQPNGRVARVTLVQLANGDPPFAPLGNRPVAQAGPRIELEFLSPSRARAYLVRSDAGRDLEVRTLTLSRSRFASGPIGTTWSGQWVLVPDDGGTPRVFDFSAAGSQDAENFHLTDTANNAHLDCRLTAGTEHPELCTLSAAALPLADFDQVGIDRITGHTDNGTSVSLLRIPH